MLTAAKRQKGTHMSTKEALLALRGRLNIEAVTVSGLDAPVHVRGLTGRERDGFESACFSQRGKNRVLDTENIRAKLLVRSLCDADGKRLFDDGDAMMLGDMPSSVLDQLFTVAQRLSGLSPSDVEELAGN
jgi:hypothetical protein